MGPSLEGILGRYPGMSWPDETATEQARRRDEFVRADGRVCCRDCGYEYWKHPEDSGAFAWLHVLCSGTRIKT